MPFADFAFHANGKKWNHFHAGFTKILVTTQAITNSDQELAVSNFAVILNVGVYESNHQNVALQTFDLKVKVW